MALSSPKGYGIRDLMSLWPQMAILKVNIIVLSILEALI